METELDETHSCLTFVFFEAVKIRDFFHFHIIMVQKKLAFCIAQLLLILLKSSDTDNKPQNHKWHVKYFVFSKESLAKDLQNI